MAEPTGREILMWALVNRARLDPAGEAARYGIDLNEGPVRDFNGAVFTITTASKQPLAWNAALFAVADQHSADMRNANPPNGALFHNSQAVHEANLTAAGYSFSSWGENVSQSAPLGAGFTETQAIYAQHQSLFVDSGTASRGHRYNIMLDSYQELGVGQVASSEGATRSWITQDFGRPSAATQFLTGIAYNDNDGDKFYSAGEGRGSISVAASAGTVVTGPAGYYARVANVGAQTVTFSGGDLGAPVSVSLTVATGRNVLLNLVGQSTVETSVSLTAISGVITIIGLGNLGLTLTGNAADNTIVSALGNDTLDGQGGTDSARFRGTLAQYALTDLGGGSVRVVGPDGSDTVNNVERLIFDDQTMSWPPAVPGSAVRNDFNADLKSDLLLTSTANGLAVWLMNGTTVTSNPQIGTMGAGWHLFDTADFNKDGKADLLLQSDARQVSIWQMNGTQVVSAPVVGVIGAGWGLLDTADFNGDGKADILLHNPSTRALSIWQMNGSQLQTSPVIGTLSPGWNFADTGDFNGDGQADILLLNPNTFGIAIWQMDGTTVEANPLVGMLASGWAFISTADFNGDSKDDLLLVNLSNGGVSIWQMNGTQVQSSPVVGTLAPGWAIIDTADFNGNAKDDLLLFNQSTRGVAIWQMNGTTVESSPLVGGLAGGWSFRETNDYNADRKADILFENVNNGALSIWQMNGTQIEAAPIIGAHANGWELFV